MFRSHVGLCVCRVMICCYACRVMLSSLWLMSRCSCIWSSAVHCSQYPALTRHGGIPRYPWCWTSPCLSFLHLSLCGCHEFILHSSIL